MSDGSMDTQYDANRDGFSHGRNRMLYGDGTGRRTPRRVECGTGGPRPTAASASPVAERRP